MKAPAGRFAGEIFLGLGSNLGDRRESLRCAVQELAAQGVRLVAASSLYESEPWGVVDQAAFLNAVIRVAADLEPAELLAACKRVEELCGRRPGRRWGPRAVDVDILLYGDQQQKTTHLTIPHPYLTERSFVVLPLLELKPDLVLPDGVRLGELVWGKKGPECGRSGGSDGLRRVMGPEWADL